MTERGGASADLDYHHLHRHHHPPPPYPQSHPSLPTPTRHQPSPAPPLLHYPLSFPYHRSALFPLWQYSQSVLIRGPSPLRIYYKLRILSLEKCMYKHINTALHACLPLVSVPVSILYCSCMQLSFHHFLSVMKLQKDKEPDGYDCSMLLDRVQYHTMPPYRFTAFLQ